MRHITPMRTLTSKLVFGTGLVLGSLAISAPTLLAQQADPQSTAPAFAPDAQTGGHHRHEDMAQRQQHMLDHMTKTLNLSPDQVSQIKGIQADMETQAQMLRSDTDRTDRRSKMMDLHKAEQDKIRGVLNDDQKAKFDAMAERRKEHMKGGPEQTPPTA